MTPNPKTETTFVAENNLCAGKVNASFLEDEVIPRKKARGRTMNRSQKRN